IDVLARPVNGRINASVPHPGSPGAGGKYPVGRVCASQRKRLREEETATDERLREEAVARKRDSATSANWTKAGQKGRPPPGGEEARVVVYQPRGVGLMHTQHKPSNA